MAGKSALGSTKVRKSYVEYVNIYEVTENELNILEGGGQSTIMMDFAISLLSIAITCVVSLCTSTFHKDIIMFSFLFVTISCMIVGVILLFLGLKNRKSTSKTVKQIKERLKLDE